MPAFIDIIQNSRRLIARSLTPLTAVIVFQILVQTLLTYLNTRLVPSFGQPPSVGPTGPIGTVMRSFDMRAVMVTQLALTGVNLWISFVFSLMTVGILRDGMKTLGYIRPVLVESLRKSGAFIVTWLLAITIIFGTVPLLFIPSIIYQVWYSLVPQAMMFEKTWGVRALAMSRYSMRGMWGNVFVYNIILTIVVLIMPAISAAAVFSPISQSVKYAINLFVIPAATVVITVGLLAFRTELYMSLRKVNHAKKVNMTPEIIGGILAVAGIMLAVFGIRAIGTIISRQVPYKMRANEMQKIATVSAIPTKTWRPSRTVGSAPSATISQNPDTVREFREVGTKLGIYNFEHKEYPSSLSALSSYFPGGVPINRDTGKPFYYHRNYDQYGNPNGFVLCPEEGASDNRCYRENVYYN